MDIKRLAPWNWFKKEDGEAGKRLPVNRRSSAEASASNALSHFHQEIDRIFDQAFGSFSMSPFRFDAPLLPSVARGVLKPSLDIGATEAQQQ